MARDSTVMQFRTDNALRLAFTEAAQRDRTTPSDALRGLVEQYVRDSLRREAARQSRVVAEAEDADEVMADVMAAQGFHDD